MIASIGFKETIFVNNYFLVYDKGHPPGVMDFYEQMHCSVCHYVITCIGLFISFSG